MKMTRSAPGILLRRSLLTAAAAAVPLLLWFPAPAAQTAHAAQVPGDESATDTQLLTERASLTVKRARSISRARMREMAASAATSGPAAAAPEVPFRPTIDAGEYQALKERAARLGASFGLGSSRGGRAVPGLQSLPTQSAAPTVVVADFAGVDQAEACGTCRPPDTHGAIGNTQFVEITNSNLNVFTRTGTELMSVRLNTFFNYEAQFVFDPRVVFDPIWDRWVAYAEAFAESATVQRIFIAISRTDDATGGWIVYNIDVNIFNNDDFWDFGQLGFDQDAVVITANVFGPTSFRGARMFAVAKARLYNGLGWSVPLWTNLQGTLAPPIVLDQSARTHLMAAPPSGTTVFHYTLRDSAHAFDQTMTVTSITVPFYTVPPNASQPGTPNQLDTLDARFQNASTQVGNRLFQVHDVALGAFPTPLWYEFNTSTDTVVQSGFFFATQTSHDFNPSIAANAGETCS